MCMSSADPGRSNTGSSCAGGGGGSLYHPGGVKLGQLWAFVQEDLIVLQAGAGELPCGGALDACLGSVSCTDVQQGTESVCWA